MKFTKAHGLGNDFILLDNRDNGLVELPALARRLCRRQTGIGADGLLLVQHSDVAAIRMRIFNSDGSEAEMCGNGIRCFAKYCRERGILQGESFSVETLAGIMEPRLITAADGTVTGVRVDMGPALLERRDVPMQGHGRCVDQEVMAGGRPYRVTSLRVGVPHTVLFVDDAADPAWMQLGAQLERHAAWPQHTNVNFVTVADAGAICLRTYERGCGATLACGTGACASAVASFLNGKTGRSVTVQLELGDLLVEYASDGRVYMTGPAEFSYEGEVAL